MTMIFVYNSTMCKFNCKMHKSQQIYSISMLVCYGYILAKSLCLMCSHAMSASDWLTAIKISKFALWEKERKEYLDLNVHIPDYSWRTVLTCSLKCVSVSQSVHICFSLMHMVHCMKTQGSRSKSPSPCLPHRPHRLDHQQPVDQNMNSMLAWTPGHR